MLALLGRSLLRPGLQQRLGVIRRCFCAAQSDRCLADIPPPPPQQADMNRGQVRGQIRRVLCVAEKNDAAKGIAAIMSDGNARRVSPVFSHIVENTLTDSAINQCFTAFKEGNTDSRLVLPCVHSVVMTMTFLSHG